MVFYAKYFQDETNLRPGKPTGRAGDEKHTTNCRTRAASRAKMQRKILASPRHARRPDAAAEDCRSHPCTRRGLWPCATLARMTAVTTSFTTIADNAQLPRLILNRSFPQEAQKNCVRAYQNGLIPEWNFNIKPMLSKRYKGPTNDSLAAQANHLAAAQKSLT